MASQTADGLRFAYLNNGESSDRAILTAYPDGSLFFSGVTFQYGYQAMVDCLASDD